MNLLPSHGYWFIPLARKMGNYTYHAMKQFILGGLTLTARSSPDCFAQILWTVKTTVLLVWSGANSSKSNKFSITGSLSSFCRHSAILVRYPGILSWSIQQVSSLELSGGSHSSLLPGQHFRVLCAGINNTHRQTRLCHRDHLPSL